MKRRVLATFLLLAGFVFFGVGGKQTSTMTPIAAAQSIAAPDCEEKDLFCGTPYKGSDGQLYEDCFCPLNGLTIQRPVF